MNSNLQKWIPIALCCLPGVAVAALVGIGLALGGAAFGTWLGGPLGLGLLALAIAACPVSMGLMMRRISKQNAEHRAENTPATQMADCCPPAEANARGVERLVELRTKREDLERELIKMQE